MFGGSDVLVVVLGGSMTIVDDEACVVTEFWWVDVVELLVMSFISQPAPGGLFAVEVVVDSDVLNLVIVVVIEVLLGDVEEIECELDVVRDDVELLLAMREIDTELLVLVLVDVDNEVTRGAGLCPGCVAKREGRGKTKITNTNTITTQLVTISII